MPSDDRATRRWLQDIRYHIDLAEGFVAGITYEAFEAEDMRLYAATRCFWMVEFERGVMLAPSKTRIKMRATTYW